MDPKELINDYLMNKVFNEVSDDCFSSGSNDQELRDKIFRSCSRCCDHRNKEEIIQSSPKRRKLVKIIINSQGSEKKNHKVTIHDHQENQKPKSDITIINIDQESHEKKDHITIDNDQESDENNDHIIITSDDLLSCEACTPSYRLVPQNFYPVSTRNDTSDIAKQVLNDTWAVVSPASSTSRRTKLVSPSDKVLNKHEDHRYELDMCYERLKSTIENLRVFSDKLREKGLPNSEASVRIEYFLTSKTLRCIEKLYGKYGLDMIEGLRLNPSKVLPRISSRLEHKKRDCERSIKSLKVVSDRKTQDNT
ncbi:Histone deacetylase interacting domain containing protein [Parasponia andersonii]|uniref:Histone deacetylase interacting domain containing protein n=1 Tax=Parasponia andersonii TaxID=3476 RepID=A0A2P5A6L1_PARAD|nr:Histone deacetylase interacting domain containing protein [Parasponia andersonii]